jgi:hypothetical protein
MNRKWLAVVACIVVGTICSASAYDGKTLRSLGGTSADAGIRVSNLSTGLYILTLHAQGKTLVQRCIVR